MRASHDGSGLKAPKFSSFRPKPPAADAAHVHQTTDHHGEVEQDGRRSHRHHHSRPRSRHSPSSRNRRPSPSRNRLQPSPGDGSTHSQAQSRPPVSRPGLFVIDTKGDPLIRKYGLDRSKIPSYRRHGSGRVLGSPGRLLIHHDGQREVFSLRLPGEASSAKSSEKGGLWSRSWHTREPLRLRAPKTTSNQDEPLEFLPLEVSRKRKRQNHGLHLDTSTPPSSASDDEQPTWRSIYGKAEPKPDADSDADSDVHQSSDAANAELDNPLQWKSVQLNRQVKQRPDDIDAWLELVDHQDSLMRAGEKIDQTATESTVRSYGEIKLHLLESALAHAARPEDRSRILPILMREGIKIWSRETVSKRWAQLREDERQSFPLWNIHLDYSMSGAAKAEYDDVKEILLNRLHLAVLPSQDDSSSANLQEAIYVFHRATRFFYDAGYKELAVAAWQALLELNFFRPNKFSTREGTLDAFREFWESELPRVGEEDANGWRQYEENGAGEVPEPRSLPAESVQLASPADGAHAEWAALESVRSRQAMMPARTMDEGTDIDPFRVVLFTDIEPMLFLIPANASADVFRQLIDAFLLFCQLPPAFRSEAWTEKAENDAFLTGPHASLHLFSAAKVAEEMTELSEASVDSRRKSPLFKRGFCRASISPSLLFGGDDWFRYLCVVETGMVGHLPWVERTVQQLVHLASFSDLSLYHLALCYARDPAAMRKPAKAVMKKYPTRSQVYIAYALAEFSQGKVEVARKVLASASESPSLSSGSGALDLCRTWSWIELVSGGTESAVGRLCAFVDSSLRQGGEVAPSAVLRARQAFSSGALRCLYEGTMEEAGLHYESLALLSYLTSARGSEPMSGAQGDIAGAMTVMDTAMAEFRRRGRADEASLEVALQFATMLLYHHCTKGPFRRIYVRQTVARFVDLFPRNTIFLSVFEWADAGMRVVDETRELLQAKVLVKASDCVSSRLLAIQHELVRGNLHSAQAALDQAVLSEACRPSVALWLSYVRFSAQGGRSRAKAKEVFYRALNSCPWSKELMMEAFSTLARDMGPDERRSVYERMLSRSLRLHLDLDDFVADRAALLEKHVP